MGRAPRGQAMASVHQPMLTRARVRMLRVRNWGRVRRSGSDGGWTEGKRMMREGSAGEGVELLRQLVREFSVRTLAEKTRRSTFDW